MRDRRRARGWHSHEPGGGLQPRVKQLGTRGGCARRYLPVGGSCDLRAHNAELVAQTSPPETFHVILVLHISPVCAVLVYIAVFLEVGRPEVTSADSLTRRFGAATA